MVTNNIGLLSQIGISIEKYVDLLYKKSHIQKFYYIVLYLRHNHHPVSSVLTCLLFGLRSCLSCALNCVAVTVVVLLGELAGKQTREYFCFVWTLYILIYYIVSSEICIVGTMYCTYCLSMYEVCKHLIKLSPTHKIPSSCWKWWIDNEKINLI